MVGDPGDPAVRAAAVELAEELARAGPPMAPRDGAGR